MIGSDGFGVGWFAAAQSLPARYRSILPIWIDENIDTMAAHVSSTVIVASSRTASRRMPIAITNTPPFVGGAALLAHNGEVMNFPDSALELMRGELSAPARAGILGNTDTEYLAALLRDRDEGRLVDRVKEMLQVASHCVEAARTAAQLNLIAATQNELIILRHAIDAAAPSLYVKHGASGLFGASEPLDDAPGWKALEPGDMVIATSGPEAPSVEWCRLDGH
jgi:glutamine amidotransferase